jgi:hypothetical protein
MNRQPPGAAVSSAPVHFWRRLKEIDMFFAGKDKVHQTMKRLVRRLKRAGIDHAIVGGMAVNVHGYERTTKDVDVLLTRDGFEEFKRRFVPKNYNLKPGLKRRFVDCANNVDVDVLVTGLYPGSGKPGPIAYPDPRDVGTPAKKIPVVDLVTLVQLKLAARRYLDFGDVVYLIRANKLDESFQERLHKSVRQDFIECLEENRREEEYMRREEG